VSKHLKVLLQILSDGNYHSGAIIGKKLNLTRSAIWKIIKQAKKYGIIIEAKTNLGYKIPKGLELLDKKRIGQNLNNKLKPKLNKILIFDTLPSTNTYLAELLKTKKFKKDMNYVCFAEHQTAGKGRLGRKWFSPFAQNIYLSLLWQFSRAPHELSSLGLVVGVAIVGALKDYGIKNNLTLKWPNDVLWQKRKLSGILIELSGETHHVYNAIIGVGLNVNMPQKVQEKIDQPWCDVAQITNTTSERNKLAGLLLKHILSTLATYQDYGSKPFIKKWQKLDVAYGKKVTIITPQQKISGIGLGINDKGYFLLKDCNGKILSFVSGEISLRF
jgi:BirA family biotin operon repressor/biotin-[acetyl-CoA-carboxylase] ligase